MSQDFGQALGVDSLQMNLDGYGNRAIVHEHSQ